jgi:hypothetical protein
MPEGQQTSIATPAFLQFVTKGDRHVRTIRPKLDRRERRHALSSKDVLPRSAPSGFAGESTGATLSRAPVALSWARSRLRGVLQHPRVDAAIIGPRGTPLTSMQL